MAIYVFPCLLLGRFLIHQCYAVTKRRSDERSILNALHPCLVTENAVVLLAQFHMVIQCGPSDDRRKGGLYNALRSVRRIPPFTSAQFRCTLHKRRPLHACNRCVCLVYTCGSCFLTYISVYLSRLLHLTDNKSRAWKIV